MNAYYFDIEIAEPYPEWDINEWDRKEKLPISCAAITGAANIDEKVWFAGMSGYKNGPAQETINAIEQGAWTVKDAMSKEEVEAMLNDLLFLVDAPGNPKLFTWNGTGFDWPAILSNAPDRLEDVVHIAQRSFDPCFQFLRQFGFPVGVEKVAIAMTGERKVGMTGLEASQQWPERAAEIITYCLGDVRLTKKAVEAIMAEKQVRWINQKEKTSAKPVNGWHTLKKIMKWDEPNRSWMDDPPESWKLENAIAWMTE